MGVYIKGMEMPKDCLKCPFCLFADGYWKCLVDGSHADFGGTCRPSLCPLIPVPPHGRLIDEKEICDKIRPLIENPYCYNRLQVISETLGNCLQIVRDVPTVIPAEEGET